MAESRQQFSRDYGCTEAEWQRWLSEAPPGCTVQRTGPLSATVELEQGRLRLMWRVLPPRRIALITLPRLHVDFVFDGTAEDARKAFMRSFDLSTQRGGG